MESQVLRRRLETSREGNFLLELDGRVAAVLYTQRIRSVEDVASQKLGFSGIFRVLSPGKSWEYWAESMLSNIWQGISSEAFQLIPKI